MKYIDELKKAMTLLSEDDRTLFIGQAVEYEGTGLYDSLKHLPYYKRLELPVAEYLQCGLANGLAIEGMIPVSTFPRWNFLLMGTDQIVNHLDKFVSMSEGELTPKVIIRVAVGSESPVDPQCQHKGNFTEAFKNLTQNIVKSKNYKAATSLISQVKTSVLDLSIFKDGKMVKDPFEWERVVD